MNRETPLSGIYAGNPTRKTKTPRTETLLRVFKGIALIIIHIGGQERFHLTDLTPTQERILHLVGLSPRVYTSLVPQGAEAIPN